MKCSQYITGRAEQGYGYYGITHHFASQERWHLQNRSEGTPNGKPILEMMCTTFGCPGIIASKTVADTSRGWYYMQTLLPVRDDSTSEACKEWEEYLQAPGRMLYFSPMETSEFRHYADKNIHDLDEYKLALPPIPDDKHLVPAMPAEMLAALLCDVWYCCYQRIDNPQPENHLTEWRTVRLELTDSENASATLETGIAFVNHVLMPALPPAVRQIVSVSIGGSWDRAADPNQHPAALQIILPRATANSDINEGTYVCTPSFQKYHPLLNKGFSTAMGRAILEDRSGSPADALSYYHIVADRHPFEEISASFELAQYLCYAKLHLMRNQKSANPDDATKAYEYMKAAEKLVAYYLDGLSESVLALYIAQLQRDVFLALAQHVSETIDAKQYRFYAQRIFSFTHAVNPSTAEEKALCEQVVSAGSALLLKAKSLAGERKIPFFQYLDEDNKKKREALIERNRRLFNDLLFDSLIQHGEEVPVEVETLIKLKDYCTRDERSASKLTQHLCKLLKSNMPLNVVLTIDHQLSDATLLSEVAAHFQRHIPQIISGDYADTSYCDYAKVLADGKQLSAVSRKLEENEARFLSDYVLNAEEDSFLPLTTIISLFKKLHMDESVHAVNALIRLLEIRNKGNLKSISEAEMEAIMATYQFASNMEDRDPYEALLKCLAEQFSQAIPQALRGSSPTAVEDSFAPWQRYMSFNPKTLPQIKRQFGGVLNNYVQQNARDLSNRVNEVLNAYRFISGEGSEQAVQSICSLIEQRKEGELSDSEAQMLKPVLEFVSANAGSESCQHFLESLRKLFKSTLPLLFDLSLPSAALADMAKPWIACMNHLGFETHPLRNQFSDDCLEYVQTNTVRLREGLSTVLNVFEVLSLSGSAAQVKSAILILSERSEDRDAVYSLADVENLAPVFARCEASPEQEDTSAFVDVLLKHFATGLPHMIADEASGLAAEVSVDPWNRTKTKIGTASFKLASGISEQLSAYTEKHAESLIHRLPQLMRLYQDVGLAKSPIVQNAVTTVLAKRPIDEQNELTMAEMGCIVDIAGRNPEIDKALISRYSYALPKLLDSSSSPNDAEGAVEVWTTYLNAGNTASIESEMRKCFAQTVERDPGLYDQRLLHLANFSAAMHWSDSEELSSSILDVLRVRNENNGFCILNDREVELVHNLLRSKASSNELIRGLQPITGHMPSLPADPEREEALKNEACRYLRILLPDMLTALPSEEMSAWHEAAMSIIIDDVLKMIHQCKNYSTLQAPGLIWNRCSTFAWLKLDDGDTLDRFSAHLLKQDLDQLERGMKNELVKAINRFNLNELLKSISKEGSGWYTRLLNSCVADLLTSHSDNLINDVSTYQDALGLRRLLEQYLGNDKSKTPLADALAFVLDHDRAPSIAEEVRAFRQLADQSSAREIIKRAVANSAEWDNRWNTDNWPEKLLYATCCYILTNEPDWDSFFEEVLSDATVAEIRKNQLSSGSTLTQIVSFIRNWFINVDEAGLADEYVSALREKRRGLYNMAESAKLKSKAYKPMLKAKPTSASNQSM